MRACATWAIALLVLLAAQVRAQQGINLSWDDCGLAGSSAKTFACDTNLGSELLVASLALPSHVCLTGYDAVLDLQTAGAILPDWWQFKNAGSCRQAALVPSANFANGPPGCLDAWQMTSTWGFTYAVGLGGPSRARIAIGVSNNIGECTSFPGSVEVGGFKLALTHDKTVGVGACQGCSEGACIVFNSLTLRTLNDPDLYLTTPLNRNFVTWQVGYADCPGSTPAQKTTWGAIKTLYR